MSVILWILCGGIAGWIASLFMQTRTEMEIISDMVVGILGATIGGWMVTLFAGPAINNFRFSTYIIAILGAALFLVIVHRLRRPLRGV